MKGLLRRLHTRLMLIGAAAIGAAVISFAIYIAWEVSSFANEGFRNEAIRLSRSLADSVSDELVLQDYAGIEEKLRHAAYLDLVESVTVADPAGKILIRVARPRPGQPDEATYGGTETVPGDTRGLVKEEHDHLVVWRPAGSAIPPLGWIRIDYSLAGLEAMSGHVLRDGLLFALLTLLGSGLLFMLLLRGPVREIERAAAFAEHLNENLGELLPVSASTIEIERLESALNDASRDLKSNETHLKRKRTLLERRNQIFELLATGGPLKDILTLIVESVEIGNPEAMGSILLVDATGRYLNLGAGPSLPNAYNHAIDGVEIAEGAGSCGTAAYRAERVIVEDIRTHPYWTNFREIAEQAGLRSCWAEPIRSSKGAVLGTLAIYHRRPLRPTPEDLEAIQSAAHLASVAIERRHLDDEMQLASSVYQASGEAMFVTDEKNRIVAVNPAFTRLTGYSATEIIGQDPKILSSGKNLPSTYKAMWLALQSTGHWQGEIWNKRKNGEEYAEWLTINTIRGEDGLVHRRIALFSDITEMKHAEEVIWQQANYDTLTNLPNRRLFRDRLQHEIGRAQRNAGALAILFVDLDRFKEVNDTLGQTMGDRLLVEMAQRISGCVRESDTVARLGADEFTVMLQNLPDPSMVEQIAHCIQTALAQPFRLGEEAIYLSASIGITLFPDDAQDVEGLLRNAESAMHTAKEAGRNTISWFTMEMQLGAQIRRELTRDLRNAITSGQFEVYYQPIVTLPGGATVKAEALIRWHHPERGMVSPGVFIPLAEEVGLIEEIGDWVFRSVVAQSKRWMDEGLENFQISVNKSPRQFATGNEEDIWLDHLAQAGLPAGRIVIEITEGLLLEDRPEVAVKLNRYREAGVEIAIDDFGTGYSALSYLQKFAIDYLKIDRSFIKDLTTDKQDRALADAIVVMAHKLGLKVVAEGVETAEQRDCLIAWGCDYAQGFYYSKPVPAPEFEALLRQAGSFH